jgi:chromosome segregation ATPase
LNNQSFLRLKEDEKNLIELEKERIANELSLVQSQLADSDSKLRQFQNVHDELETTKCELEEKKREITEIKGENLQLTNENSGLWRKIEAKDRVIAYKRVNLEKLQNSLEEKKLHKVHEELASSQRVLASKNRAITKLQEQNRESRVELEQLRTCLNEQQLDTRELAIATSELESKNTTISELETENLRLAENDSQLWRNIEDRDKIIASSAIEKYQILLDKERLENELSQVQSQLADSSSKLQMFQNVHDELAATKSELEETKSLNSANTGENLHLTNENSGLRRTIEDRDKIMASSAIEKNQIVLEKPTFGE